MLSARCAVCHHAGEIAPFSLLGYEDAKERARAIAVATAARYTSRWQPEPGYGVFANERRLSEQQIQTLQDWAAAGAPEGDARARPRAPAFIDGWQLGKPDLVLNMEKPYAVATNSPESYRCFVIPTGLSSDHYASAVELQPETPGVIHHAILVRDLHHAARHLEGKSGEGYPCGGGFGFAMPGMLTMWTAGTIAHADPAGVGTILKKGTDLVLQVHMRSRKDQAYARVRIGLYFSKKPPQRTPLDLSETSYDLDIPAGDANYEVSAFSYVLADVDAVSIFAHAHYLAKRFRVVATLPSLESKPLLLIDRWNFDWQENYWFASPVRLPQGARIDLQVVYDNSRGNWRNPNSPPRRVTWGFFTTDEMCEVHIRSIPVAANQDLPVEDAH